MTWAGRRTYLSSMAVVLVAGLLLGACEGERRQAVDLYGPHFCYRTLAEVDCDPTSLAGEDHRAVGHFEPAQGQTMAEPRN